MIRKLFVIIAIIIMIIAIISYGLEYGQIELLHIPAFVTIILFFVVNSKSLPEE